MADFTEDQIAQVSRETGATPDFVRSQLESEGHRVLPTQPAAAAQPAFPSAAQAVPADVAPEAPQQGQWFGAVRPGTTPASMSPAVTPQNVALGIQSANAQRPQAAPPGAQIRVRATGQGLPQMQQQTGPQMTGSMSRVRKLFDARERGLAAEYQQAAEAYSQSAQKLQGLEDQFISAEQQRLNQEAMRADELAMQYGDLQAQQMDAMAREEQAQAKANEVVEAKLAQQQKRWDEWSEKKVKGQSIGQRLGNAFALALSGIGDAIAARGGATTNNLNRTLQIVNDAIDRDIQEQLRQIDAEGRAITEEGRMLGELRQMYRDDATFRAMARAAMQDVFAAKAQEIAAKASSDTARATASTMATQMRMLSEQGRAQGLAASADEARKALRENADARFGVEIGVAMPKPVGKGKDEKATPGVVGLVQIAPEATSEDRKKAQEIVSKNNSLLSTIRELKGMAKQGGTLDQTKRAHVQQLLNRFIGQNSQAFGSGTPQEAEAKRAMDAMADPTAVVTWKDAVRSYDMLERSTIDSANAQIQPYGYAIGGAASFEEE